MRHDARRCEQFEMSVAAKVGLGTAVEYALGVGLQTARRRIDHLATLMRRRLGACDGVEVRDKGARLCGIVSFTVEGVSGSEVQRAAGVEGINVSISSIGSSRLDFEARGLRDVVRASVHYYNTEWEIDALVAVVKTLV